MKDYKEMTREEINAIIRKGGDELKKLNQAVADYLDSLDLSKEAYNIIADTDINNIAEVFGGLFAVEQIESFIKENYCDED